MNLQEACCPWGKMGLQYPDYITQGEGAEDFQEHLEDLFCDLTGGEIPGIQRLQRDPR